MPNPYFGTNPPPEPPFAVIPLALLTNLEALFPDKCPPPEASDKDVHLRMGEQRVLAFLRRKYEEQSENILTT